MKVNVEYEALLRLLMLCGEAKSELEFAGSLRNNGPYTSDRFLLQPSATRMAERLAQGVAAIITTPAVVTQEEFHSGPG